VAPIRTVGAEAWSELITGNFIALSVRDARDDFRGELDRRDLGRGVSLTEVTTRPSRVLRTSRLAAGDACDDVLFLVHRGGVGTVSQDRRCTPLRPGFGSVHDASCPYELSFSSPSRELVLQLPKRLLPSADLVGPGRRAREVAATEPAMRVFSAFCRELLAVSDELDGLGREEMGQTAIDLLTSVLRRGGEPGPVPSGPAALLVTLQGFVRANLADPDLTAESLAAGHHISPRYAQKLFAGTGTTPAGYIRSQRLRAAHRALRDARLDHVPVAGIAHRVGFRGADTFIRAFRREFGVTPGEWRRGG
jgi:AraC-like DNA-binding protein